MKNLMIHNLIALGGVALTNFVFIKYITTQYMSADPNYVKLKVLENLEEMRKKKPVSNENMSEYVFTKLYDANIINNNMLKEKIKEGVHSMKEDLVGFELKNNYSLESVSNSHLGRRNDDVNYGLLNETIE
jgi:hypothetical protein